MRQGQGLLVVVTAALLQPHEGVVLRRSGCKH